MTQKEELSNKFKQIWHNALCRPTVLYQMREEIFDFFYSEIEFWKKSFDERTSDFKKSEDKISHLESTLEAKDKELIDLSSHTRQTEKSLRVEISHLESLVKEADGIVRQYEMGDLSQVELCIKHYNQLKTKSQS